MTTRKICASPRCEGVGYFEPRQEWETVCDQCIAKAHDLASAEISQDNGEISNFLAPIDALSLARARVELAKTLQELHRWKALAKSHQHTICAIAAPRQLLGNQRKLAERQLEICYSDFADLLPEIVGPVYAEKRG